MSSLALSFVHCEMVDPDSTGMGETNFEVGLNLDGGVTTGGTTGGTTGTVCTPQGDKLIFVNRWEYTIGNATFTNLYSAYYDAAIRRICQTRGLSAAACATLEQNELYRRTLPYYNPSHGILVTKALKQLATEEYTLSWLVAGIDLELFFGPSVVMETDSLLSGLCNYNRVSFVSTAEFIRWKTRNPTWYTNYVAKSRGGAFTAVYCKRCEPNVSWLAIENVLTGLQTQYDQMVAQVANPTPNAPTWAACDSNAMCEARAQDPLVDTWTNNRCVFSNTYEEDVCISYSILNGRCPGSGSQGVREFPCDTGLRCVKTYTGNSFSLDPNLYYNRYQCRP